MASGIHSDGALLVMPVGIHLNHGNLHDTVVGNVGAGGFEVEKHHRFCQIKLHNRKN